MLASLHTVLWEGSGWTPPNMSDIVEGGKVGGFWVGSAAYADCEAACYARHCCHHHAMPDTCSLRPPILLPQVKRWYMKANLVVHPDKVKQKGGTLEQVTTADMLFDVLKAAWGKFEASGR